MRLYPSQEEGDLLTAARRLLDNTSPVAKGTFDAAKAVADRATWRQYAGLGWCDADLGRSPEFRHGQVFLQQRAGAALLRGPITGTVVGSALLARSGAGAEYEAVRDGRRRIGLAEPAGQGMYTAWDVDDVDYHVVVSQAETLLVPAADVALTRMPAVEDGRDIGTFTLLPAEPVVKESGPDGFLHACLLVAAELCGVLEGVTDMSANYAKQRQQFGVPIGTFQAVKHRCAEMVVRFESAWALCCLAAVYLSDGTDEAPAYVHAAKLLAGEYGLASCKDNVQNHGGIGFTAECNAHHFFKRAMTLGRTVGDRYDGVVALAGQGYGLGVGVS